MKTKTNTSANVAAKNAKAVTAPKSLANSDLIVESKGANGGKYTAVSTGDAKNGGRVTMVPNTRFIGDVAKTGSVGGSYKAFLAAWAKAQAESPAQMARGIKQGQAPQSAKALADAARVAKGANKADAATQKPTAGKAPKAKAPKADAPKAASKYSGEYKWVGENKAREGTWRFVMLKCAETNTNTAAGDKCITKNREFGTRKIDWRWMANQNYIKFA